MNLIGTRQLETDRCLLRQIRPDDYKPMYENWARYEEVCRYFPFHPVHDIEEYREKVNRWASSYRSGDYFHWVIEWKENGQLIGTINLGNVEDSCFMSDTNTSHMNNAGKRPVYRAKQLTNTIMLLCYPANLAVVTPGSAPVTDS